MTASLLATAVALAIGLPIIALWSISVRAGGRLTGNRHTSPTRKDIP